MRERGRGEAREGLLRLVGDHDRERERGQRHEAHQHDADERGAVVPEEPTRPARERGEVRHVRREREQAIVRGRVERLTHDYGDYARYVPQGSPRGLLVLCEDGWLQRLEGDDSWTTLNEPGWGEAWCLAGWTGG